MRKFNFPVSLLCMAFVSGCHGGLIGPAKDRGEAILQPTQASAVNGKVSFNAAGKKLRVIAEVSGLTPGAHGFHIHELGDCSAPDGSSAGPHFNPDGKPHGNPLDAEHHAGDLPQLIADAKGNAGLTAYIEGPELGEGERGIFGRAVIVHAAPDDFKTQPAGNSGPRIACGVIVGK